MKTNPDTIAGFDVEFTRLLESWNDHQNLRTDCADLICLADSHQSLFRQRLRTAELAKAA